MLVTGASGFVGRHLVTQLEHSGWIVRRSPRRELASETTHRDALQGAQAVVHLAALAHGRALAFERTRDYESLRRVNVEGTERLAREAAGAGVRHFLFLSSIGVCGDETLGAPLTEESPPAPRSLYARSKLEAEQVLAAISGLGLTVLRPTLVYGPQNGGNMLRLLQAIHGRLPLPLGAVQNRRNLTYIGNLTSAIAAALQRGPAGTLLICDAQAVSTPELIVALARGMGRRALLFPVPPPLLNFLRGSDTVRRLTGSLEADCRKAQRVLGWTPEVSASDGLARTGAWFASQ